VTKTPLDFLAHLVGDPVADARNRLPKDVADRAWEEGARMSMTEAIDLARNAPPLPSAMT
jgi:hypothetical protein